ncbi:OsmC family protein [Microbacterium sp. YY-01]|uniref:OsmC family protein n=1 Tax=Microbacterium sp. YY-01 TaxID=3421634 RepID=UPI003D168406
MAWGEHHYALTATWTGNKGTGTSGYRDYSRDITVRIDGKPDSYGSADRVFHGDAERWNPEDHLLAALSQCHLLSYLHVCVREQIIVTAYHDRAAAVLQQDNNGGGAITEVILRPHVTVADAAMMEAALHAHEQAQKLCFIANSVAFPVRHEATVSTADAAQRSIR